MVNIINFHDVWLLPTIRPCNKDANPELMRLALKLATGAGKTYTAVTTAYRLLKFGGFLSLVVTRIRESICILNALLEIDGTFGKC